MYAATPPKHLNTTEKPSGSSPVAVCMRDDNFSRHGDLGLKPAKTQ